MILIVNVVKFGCRNTERKLIMNKRVMLSCVFLLTTGCSMLNPFVKDIKGWDLSACVGKDEFKVCKELFLDNKDKIFGGEDAVNMVVEQMQIETFQVDNE